jgi:hypothetical protein
MQYIEQKPMDPDSRQISKAAFDALPLPSHETVWVKNDTVCQIK